MRNSARHALSYQDAVALGEVASSAGIALLAILTTAASLLILHGVDATHTTVSLDKLAFPGDERSSRRLCGTSQETTHHDSRGAECKTLDNVTNVLDTTVGDARNAETRRERADVVDGSRLRTTNGHNFLSDAGASAAHTNTEAINTSSDQSSSLLSGHHIATNDIQVGELVLDPLDHLNLVHAVTLAAVQDNNVQTGLNKLGKTELVLGASANSSGAEELLGVWELGGIGEVEVLGQIGAGNHGDEVSVLVHNGQFALLRLGQDLVCLSECDARLGSDEIGNHDIGDRLFVVVLELDVAVGNDTKKLGSKLSGFCKSTKVSALQRHI